MRFSPPTNCPARLGSVEAQVIPRSWVGGFKTSMSSSSELGSLLLMLKDLGRNDLRGCFAEFSSAGLSFCFPFTLFTSPRFTLGLVSVPISAQQPSQSLPWADKEWYQAFFWVLIDLIIGFFGLIIKVFDHQTEIWAWLSSPLIIKLCELLDDNHDYFVYKTFTHKSNKTD